MKVLANKKGQSYLDHNFKFLQILFIVLIALQFIYFLAALIIVGEGTFIGLKDWNNLIYLTVPVYNFSIVLGINKKYKNKLAKAVINLSLNSKMQSYRAINIERMMWQSAINVFNITFFIIQHEYIFVLFIIFMIVISFLYKPSKQKFILDYKIYPSELQRLNN